MSKFDTALNDQWDRLREARRQYVQAAPIWNASLSSGSGQRSLVLSIGIRSSNLLKLVLAADPVALEPIARQDLNDAAFDLAATLTAVDTSLKAVTTTVKSLWDTAGGQTLGMTRALDGTLALSEMTVSATATATLRTEIDAVVAALSPA